jgi:hypothetical protein
VHSLVRPHIRWLSCANRKNTIFYSSFYFPRPTKTMSGCHLPMGRLFFSQFLCCFPHLVKSLFSLLSHNLPSDMLHLSMVLLLNLRCIVRVRKFPLFLSKKIGDCLHSYVKGLLNMCQWRAWGLSHCQLSIISKFVMNEERCRPRVQVR